ncbi:MAG: methyltransferase domain-containing protein [Bacteroidaceae bacterium]|nr:methyltransferase domain-containing protein [Bacteroidaceae bacterium]
MAEYTEALDNEGWSAHYNLDSLNQVVNGILTGDVSVWSKELVDITKEGDNVLEIGCGSGSSSLWLARNNRNVTALDYAQSSIALVKAAAEKIGG